MFGNKKRIEELNRKLDEWLDYDGALQVELRGVKKMLQGHEERFDACGEAIKAVRQDLESANKRFEEAEATLKLIDETCATTILPRLSKAEQVIEAAAVKLNALDASLATMKQSFNNNMAAFAMRLQAPPSPTVFQGLEHAKNSSPEAQTSAVSAPAEQTGAAQSIAPPTPVAAPVALTPEPDPNGQDPCAGSPS